MTLSRFDPAAGRATKKIAGKSILYVEDEDMNWEVTEFSLRDKYALKRAKTAREAFEQVEKHTFDLILMDIQLSGSELNGIEITQILKGRFEGTPPAYARRAKPVDTPIVFVTAYQARYRKDELLEAGGDDLIVKPVDFTRMSLAMTRLLMRSI